VAVIAPACASAPPGDGFSPEPASHGTKNTSAGDAAADHTSPSKDAGTLHLARESGAEGAAPCVGLACSVTSCGPGSSTSVKGTVYAPNGTLPLYNARVFIPNGPLESLAKGVQCQNCGTPLTGNPIAVALSDAQGNFTLKGAPDGANIPIVVQLGKWRRQAIIPTVAPCVTNTLTDPDLTRLPKNQTEGNMPHIALTTGGCDSLGCMLPKVGIDAAEFGFESDGYAKAINIYNGDNIPPSGVPTATPAEDIWGNATLLATYDMAIFSCECSEALDSKGGSAASPDFGIVTSYLDQGGRVFTTDFQYTWYKYSTDPKLAGIGDITGGAPEEGSNPKSTPIPVWDSLSLSTSFPKGKALADWLETVSPGSPYGVVTPDVIWGNFQSITSVPTLWGSSPDTGLMTPMLPRVMTTNTPVGAATSDQCGKGVHIDAHINQGDPYNIVGCNPTTGACYPRSCASTLKEDEAMFAFFFFDLASCIQNDTQPPPPPPVIK